MLNGKPEIMFIVKARLSPRHDADYFKITSERDLSEIISLLRDDWDSVAWRKITKRDTMLEGILKRCSLGSKQERANLQAYYNMQ